MILYKTVEKEGHGEQTIEKSRFIGHVKPIETREEGEDFIKEIRAQYKDASHNVPAIVLGDKFQIQWGSDDGEPQGTSGAPIVQMLVSEGLTNVVVVVTRYYGGIKLGTGGLVRAYTGSAKLAIEKAGIHQVKSKYVLTAKVDYTFLPKLQNIVKDDNIDIENIIYEEAVTLDLIADEEDKERVNAVLNNVTGGTAKIVSEVVKNT